MIIYKILNKKDGKIYIGATTLTLKKRLKEHFKGKSLVGSKIKEEGIENFEITEIDYANNKNCLLKKEFFWVRYFDCILPKGYNKCEGGGKTLGFKHTKNSKEKMSVSRKGKYTGEENHFFGKTHSEETRKKFSEQRKGRKLTPEWREKVVAKLKRRKVICLTTGEKFNSLKEASEKFNINSTHISAVCRKKRKTTKGLSFEYLD